MAIAASTSPLSDSSRASGAIESRSRLSRVASAAWPLAGESRLRLAAGRWIIAPSAETRRLPAFNPSARLSSRTVAGRVPRRRDDFLPSGVLGDAGLRFELASRRPAPGARQCSRAPRRSPALRDEADVECEYPNLPRAPKATRRSTGPPPRARPRSSPGRQCHCIAPIEAIERVETRRRPVSPQERRARSACSTPLYSARRSTLFEQHA